MREAARLLRTKLPRLSILEATIKNIFHSCEVLELRVFVNTNRNMPQNYTYPEPMDCLNELTSYDYDSVIYDYDS